MELFPDKVGGIFKLRFHAPQFNWNPVTVTARGENWRDEDVVMYLGKCIFLKLDTQGKRKVYWFDSPEGIEPTKSTFDELFQEAYPTIS